MKIFKSLKPLIIAILILFSFHGSVNAQSPDGDGKVLFGGTYTLLPGETLNGDLFSVGSDITIGKGARIAGSIVNIGGDISIYGVVDGELLALGGNVSLGNESVIGGNLTTLNASLLQEQGAVIKGTVTKEDFKALETRFLPLFNRSLENTPKNSLQSIKDLLKPIQLVIWEVFKAFSLAALAMLVLLFFEKPTSRVAKAAVTQPVITGGLGLLTLFVAPVIIILLAITILLIPISLAGLLIISISLLYGWIAIGYELGTRISHSFGWKCAAPACGGIGTLSLSLLTSAINWIPCIGWIASALVLILGLGAVLLARFGISGHEKSNGDTGVSIINDPKEAPEISVDSNKTPLI